MVQSIKQKRQIKNLFLPRESSSLVQGYVYAFRLAQIQYIETFDLNIRSILFDILGCKPWADAYVQNPAILLDESFVRFKVHGNLAQHALANGLMLFW